MELAFGVSSTNVVKLPFFQSCSRTPSIVADFDLKSMTFGDLPVRRSKSDDPIGTVEYYDDYSFVPYDKFTTNLVIDAIQIGRSSVAFFVGNDLYTIDLSQGLKRLFQLNTSSGRHRFVLVEMPPAVYGEHDVDELVIRDPDEIDGYIPPEFSCPITMEIMTMPVVAADGNTYEKKAILRWMMNRMFSPVTGTPLAHSNLTLNLALRKLIADTCCDNSKPASHEANETESASSTADTSKRKANALSEGKEVDGSTSSGKKKMKTMCDSSV